MRTQIASLLVVYSIATLAQAAADLNPSGISPSQTAFTGLTGQSVSVPFSCPACMGTPQWSILSGALPGGLSLNPSTGLVSGTLTTAQNVSFQIGATESATLTASRTYQFFTDNPLVFQTASSLAPTSSGIA